LLGWTITRTRAQRKWAVAASGGALAVLMALAIVGRPWVNMWPRAGEEECYWGDQALQSERNAEAARWFADATRLKPKNATYWYGLGIARHRLKDYAGASVAYGRAAEIEPGNANYASTAQTMKTYVNETRSATTRPPS